MKKEIGKSFLSVLQHYNPSSGERAYRIGPFSKILIKGKGFATLLWIDFFALSDNKIIFFKLKIDLGETEKTTDLNRLT